MRIYASAGSRQPWLAPHSFAHNGWPSLSGSGLSFPSKPTLYLIRRNVSAVFPRLRVSELNNALCEDEHETRGPTARAAKAHARIDRDRGKAIHPPLEAYPSDIALFSHSFK